ncbi:MAG TPA: type II secretion system protein [Thermoanaerobaculia bacterium]|nr:type II secretion system protein [Thermoanaerobaculia bacterium]
MRRAPQSGFTLLEVLVALAILGVALLMGMSLLLQAPRIQRRLDARRDAMLTAESALELIRAGAVPLQPGQIDTSAAGVDLPSGSSLRLEVVPVSPPGLYEVKVEVRYKTQGQVRDVDVETMVWRP